MVAIYFGICLVHTSKTEIDIIPNDIGGFAATSQMRIFLFFNILSICDISDRPHKFNDVSFYSFNSLDSLNGNLHTSNDIVLNTLAKIREISTVTGDPYNQIPMILRMVLRIYQFFVSHNIQLNPLTTHCGIGFYEHAEFFQVFTGSQR